MNAVRFVSKWPFDEHSELHTSFGIALRHTSEPYTFHSALAIRNRTIRYTRTRNSEDHCRSLEITGDHCKASTEHPEISLKFIQIFESSEI